MMKIFSGKLILSTMNINNLLLRDLTGDFSCYQLTTLKSFKNPVLNKTDQSRQFKEDEDLASNTSH